MCPKGAGRTFARGRRAGRRWLLLCYFWHHVSRGEEKRGVLVGDIYLLPIDPRKFTLCVGRLRYRTPFQHEGKIQWSQFYHFLSLCSVLQQGLCLLLWLFVLFKQRDEQRGLRVFKGTFVAKENSLRRSSLMKQQRVESLVV